MAGSRNRTYDTMLHKLREQADSVYGVLEQMCLKQYPDAECFTEVPAAENEKLKLLAELKEAMLEAEAWTRNLLTQHMSFERSMYNILFGAFIRFESVPTCIWSSPAIHGPGPHAYDTSSAQPAINDGRFSTS